MTQLEPIILGWIVSSVLLGIQHVLLWKRPWKIDPPWNYVLGVGTILAGCGVWAITLGSVLVRPADAVGAFALISSSGLWVIFGYWLRARLARKHQAGKKARAGLALTQEIIDAAGETSTYRER